MSSNINRRHHGATARIRDQKESEPKFTQIKLRPCQRIGQISRDLEKEQGARNELLPHDEKKLTKEQALAQAGISLRTANRYEDLAGPRTRTASQSIQRQS